MKAGPNAGKSFNVPTVPTSCPKDSPKAVHWIVLIFCQAPTISALLLGATPMKRRTSPTGGGTTPKGGGQVLQGRSSAPEEEEGRRRG